VVAAISTTHQPPAQPENQQPEQLTLEEFLTLPPTEPESEYIKGKIYQKPMPQIEHSVIQLELASKINQVARPNKLAYAFPELRCTFGGDAIAPDIVVLEWAKIPQSEDGKPQGKIDYAPDWIIEILSPDQSPSRLINKIYTCINHGTKLGWLIDPARERVMIFQGDSIPEQRTAQDQLLALEILDNWQLSAADLFSWLYVG